MAHHPSLQTTSSIGAPPFPSNRPWQDLLQDVSWPSLPKVTFFLADVVVGAALGASAVLMHDWLSTLLPRGLLGAAGEMSIIMTMQMLLCFALGAVVGSMEVMIPGNLVGLLAMALPVLPIPMGANAIFVAGVFGALVFTLFAVWNTLLEGRAQRLLPIPPNFRVVPVAKNSLRLPWWLYDALEYAGSRRRGALQKSLFSKIRGKTLFVAAGSGLNFRNLPPEAEIVAIEIDQRKLVRAQVRAQTVGGAISAQYADVQQLPFADCSFDSIATASTLCSVPDPFAALQQMHRVLKPGGRLLMFEHVRSRNPLVGAELDLLSPVMRLLGPVINRDTIAAVRTAGFTVDLVTCGYLDVFLLIEAHKAEEC